MKKRLKEKKLTFLYTERIYKKGYENYKWPLRLVRHFFKYSRYKSFYLLCASAYASADFSRTCSFVNKAYKWGYFTELIRYKDIDLLNIIDKTKYGSDGMGGIITKGTMYVGYPR